MRITFILPTADMSGGTRVVAIYARALAARGHSVVIVCPPPQSIPVRSKIRSALTGNGWPQDPTIAKSHLNGIDVPLRTLDRVRPVGDADVPDADVVIATWWETAEWVAALSPAKGAKAYFIQHHETFKYLPIARCRATYRLPLHKIVVANWLKKVMHDEYNDGDVDLVHNSVSHEQFRAPVRNKQTVPTVGFLYHPTRFKGVDVTLKAIALLGADFPDLRVISFGAHKPTHNFDQRVEFELLPRQDKLRDLYAQCDVWLTASRSEGFNLPAMEAMACRTPVVSTRTGWPEEAIENGVNGVLVDVDDAAALARGAAWALRLDNESWKRLSRAAYEAVEGSSWETATTNFERALQRAYHKRANC